MINNSIPFVSISFYHFIQCFPFLGLLALQANKEESTVSGKKSRSISSTFKFIIPY